MGFAALAYLVAYGARTPLLALRGMLRVRNIAVVVVPAAAMGAFALLADGRLDARVTAGAIALAVVPAPFVGPELVGRMRGRADLAGALVLGTVIATILVLGSRAPAAGALFTATEAFALTAMFASVLPTIRDALLLPLRVAGWLAVAIVFASVALQLPSIDGATVLAATALLVIGVASAAIVASALGRDVAAAIGGAGLRDPALGIVLATITAGPDSTGVPLVYGVFCLVLAAAALRSR